MYGISMKIHEGNWESFRDKVLSKWFLSDSPVLKSWVITGESCPWKYAQFTAEYSEDIDWVTSVLPDGGEYREGIYAPGW